MQLYKRMLPMVAGALVVTSSVFAIEDTNELNERDTQAVEQFVQMKREAPLEDKDEELSIAGQVRFEYQHKREKIGGEKIRGSGSGTMVNGHKCMLEGNNGFDVEFNLTVDYHNENTWAAVKIAFDNDAGTSWNCDGEACGTGGCDKLCLERAYMGYRVYEYDEGEIDIEVGRRKLYSAFDSKVQFSSRMDGGLLTFRHTFDEVGQLTVKGGIFVVDSVIDNYGLATEVGMSDIMDTGLTVKYSFIDWTKSRDRCGSTDLSESVCLRLWNVQNSQLSATYSFTPEFLEKTVKAYAGFVYNHAAKKVSETSDKENIAWYVGFVVGKVKGEGDWSVEMNYQHVELQAVPDKDSGGIGLGNYNKNCSAGSTSAPYLGNTNFKGFLIEGLYAITDHLTVNVEAEFATEENKKLTDGDDIDYKKYEIEFIYAF